MYSVSVILNSTCKHKTKVIVINRCTSKKQKKKKQRFSFDGYSVTES